MPINISINEQAGRLVVTVEGDLNNTATKQAVQSFAPIYEHTDCDVAIECSKLNYISSSGLRLMLDIYKHTRANAHNAILCHLPDDIKEVFDLSGFLQLFKVED